MELWLERRAGSLDVCDASIGSVIVQSNKNTDRLRGPLIAPDSNAVHLREVRVTGRMLSASEYEDGITRLIQSSIKEKAAAYAQLKQEFHNLLDTRVVPLKDRLIDATLNGFASSGDNLGCASRDLLVELSKLKDGSENLRQAIQHVETLRERLDAAHKYVATIQEVRVCNAELR